jgi:hypothetical protein
MPMNSICPNSADRDAGIAHAGAAIRTRRQELEHEIEKLTADCDALARAEGLVAHDQGRAPKTPDSRISNRSNPPAVESEVRPDDSAFPTGVRIAIRALAEKLPGRFTASEVLFQLQAQGFEFAGDPKAGEGRIICALSRQTSDIPHRGSRNWRPA